MSIRLFVIAGLLLAAGCAHHEAALPTCDGSDRRPANPHGSVLAGTPMSTPAPAASETGTGGCA